jgi:DNA-binding transcriptional LysR family regulator
VRELLLGSIDDILDGTVNVAFTRLHPGQTELEVEILAQGPRVVALAVNHPLAERASLTYAALRDEDFIINPAVRDEVPPPRWVEEQRRHVSVAPNTPVSSAGLGVTCSVAQHPACVCAACGSVAALAAAA